MEKRELKETKSDQPGFRKYEWVDPKGRGKHIRYTKIGSSIDIQYQTN